MSLTRSIFNEFRPFFRLFDEVSRTHPSYTVLNRRFDRHFDEFPYSRRPFIDLSEQGNEYVMEAELLGVKRDNLDVSVGDNGRSVTIEGRIFARSSPSAESNTVASEGPDTQAAQAHNTSGEVVQAPTRASTQISPERDSVGSSHFTRTVWLPRPVNASKVTGNLSDGILTLHIPKAEEQDSVKVDIK